VDRPWPLQEVRRVKKMKEKDTFLLLTVLVSVLVMVSCESTGTKQVPEPEEEVAEETVGPNQLTQAEIDDGWVLLFDGETSAGWTGYKKEAFPTGWEIVDGTMYCKGSGRGEAGGVEGGDVVYAKPFLNFHLKLEWKISEGGNSGIFYLGQDSQDFIWKTAPEMQVLDNERNPDAQAGVDGNRQAGALYDLVPAKPQNAKPAGQWNSAEIKVYKGTVWHYQNGEVVLEYHLWTPEWNEMVAGSKFPALNPDWANVASEGLIGLQDHGDDVWYRNIKIKVME
jgi:hypothetical protein